MKGDGFELDRPNDPHRTPADGEREPAYDETAVLTLVRAKALAQATMTMPVRADAESVAAAATANTWKQLSRAPAIATDMNQLDAVVYEITARLVCNYYARERRREKRETSDPLVIESVQSRSRNPEQDLEARQLIGVVNRALDTLTHSMREAFCLRHLDGLTPGSIAKILGAPVGTVKSNIKRAREALRAQLGAQGYDAGSLSESDR
jgi:RNA polymerase sigma-70 factor (ECF subfamily)